MASLYSRRRAIGIFAAAAGLPLLIGAKPGFRTFNWTGQALGAPATLILNHDDPAEAERLIARVVAEVSRLEAIFSLYRTDSALAELNRVGGLAVPPPELVSLLQSCERFWTMSGGAFDPTVQPLWVLYRDHFAAAGDSASGPSRQEIGRALGRIGFDAIRFDRDRIAFARPGMALTLNGVAQGYITDRVVDILRNAGVTSSLVDMGEDRAIGTRADGAPWRVGLAVHEDAERPDVVLDVVDKAVATSSADGFHFDDAGRFGHILDPRSGGTPMFYRRVTVVAQDATTADGLSTAFSLMAERDIRSVVAKRSDLAVDLVDAAGVHKRFGAVT